MIRKATSTMNLLLLLIIMYYYSYYSVHLVLAKHENFNRYNDDDYCDNGNDEPSTSACSGNNKAKGFICKEVKLGDSARKLVHASMVNDGIKDCCDCSDEYDNGINNFECINTCGEMSEEEKMRREIYEKGKEIRNIYVAQSHERKLECSDQCDVSNFDFGPDNVYWIMKDKCFTYQEPNSYTYEVCIFGQAKQDKTSIGLFTRFENNYSEMIYEGGEKCWKGPARSLTLELECGVDDKILSVKEWQRCQYKMRFQTPAACV